MNIEEALGLKSINLDSIHPTSMGGLWYYQMHTQWAISAYLLSLSLIVIALLVGISAAKSPLGNVLTTVCISVRMSVYKIILQIMI